MTNDNWENKEKLGIRTKIGLRILFLMFKILSPYEFASKFEKEIDALIKVMDESE